MNKNLTTNLLLFLPIKIIFLNLFYVNVMDFAYGHDLIFVQEPNNIDEYKIGFIQFSGNPQNPQSQSGSSLQATTATTTNNSNNNNHRLVTCNHNNNNNSSSEQQQSPSGNLLGAQQPPSSESESLSTLSEELQRLLIDIPSQFPDDLLRADPSLLEKEISSSSEMKVQFH